MTPMTVERSIRISAPRERVWQAVTDPDMIVQWFVPNLPGARMQRSDDGKLTLYMGEMGVDLLTQVSEDVQTCVAYRSLPDQLLTTTYTLEDKGEGTDLTIIMSGFEKLPQNAREDRVKLSEAGWEKTLKNLSAAVAASPLPFPHAFVGPLFGHWREPEKKLAVERSIWINASRERVWQALVDPKQIQQWFSPTTPWQLSALEVGGRFYVQNAETQTEMYVEVIEVLEPPHRLTTRCLPEAPDTAVKYKAYTLMEEEGGTRLLLAYAGYEAESDESRWGHMEENSVGFGMMMQNIKAFAEGQSLPFPFGF